MVANLDGGPVLRAPLLVSDGGESRTTPDLSVALGCTPNKGVFVPTFGRPTMRTSLFLLLSVMLPLALASSGRLATADETQHTMMLPGDIKWGEPPPGC